MYADDSRGMLVWGAGFSYPLPDRINEWLPTPTDGRRDSGQPGRVAYNSHSALLSQSGCVEVSGKQVSDLNGKRFVDERWRKCSQQ